MTRVLLLLLLVAGCAGADKPFTPRQAERPTGQPVASTPRAEVITIDDQMSVSVEWPAGADTTMLRAFTDLYLDSWRSVFTGSQAYLELVEPPASGQAHEWVKSFGGAKVKGSARLYSLRVSAVVDDGAEVNACVDETGVRLLNRSGNVHSRQPGWTRTPYLQAVVLHKGQDGTWRVKDFRHDLKGCA
ncbi:hypothetical protein ACIBH1_02700 [Nonomuraea sp. NPDC050663]|uniref:hypothetical protein n=1 Tax=Nonomuraea sp. NPDC050663 TaxID=3364370 RepID=UPI00379C903B